MNNAISTSLSLQFLEDTGFLACKPAQVPMDLKTHLIFIDGDVLPIFLNTDVLWVDSYISLAQILPLLFTDLANLLLNLQP